VRSSSNSEKVSLIVTSKASDPDVPPLVVESSMSTPEIDNAGVPMVVYAKVHRVKPVL